MKGIGALLFGILTIKNAYSGDLSLVQSLPVESRFEFALWNLQNYGQPFRIDKMNLGESGVAGADISMVDAWTIQKSADGVMVAILDAGFDLDHPDLDGVFYLEDAYDFLRGTGLEPRSQSHSHHGTFVSGVIGALATNRIGITGIAPGVQILPLRVIPEKGDESDHTVTMAIRYAVDAGARVINCSFSKDSTSADVKAAIAYAREHNVLIVAAAGNQGRFVDARPRWPASFSTEFDNVISVAATDRRDELWPSSNRGRTVDLAAPGHEIFTTGNPAIDIQRYMSFSGTSAAAPHVAAVAALMIAHHPQITASELREILVRSADVKTQLKPYTKTGGRLNAFRALQVVAERRNRSGCTGRPTLIAQDELELTFDWSLPASVLSLPGNADKDPVLRAHRAWVREHTPLSSMDLLKHHIEVISKEAAKLDTDSPFAIRMRQQARDASRILNGEIGKIRKLGCLESLPFRELASNVDLRAYNVEFSATALLRGSELRLIASFELPRSSKNTGSAQESAAARNLRSQLMLEGWRILRHIHNHPFNFSNPYGDLGGTLAPSNADLRFYRKANIPEAVITNGIDSLFLEQTEFNYFDTKNSWEPIPSAN